jgi:cysteine-rich repeat protein
MGSMRSVWARSAGMAAAAVCLGVASPAWATFHLWRLSEVYSNADGGVQFVELSTSSSGQNVLNGRQLDFFENGASTPTYTYTLTGSTIPSGTANHHLLFGTTGYAALTGEPAADFVIPGQAGCNCLFSTASTSVRIRLWDGSALTAFDQTFTTSTLPLDGTSSLNWSGSTSTPGTSSPTNFAGATCILSCPAAGACTADNGGCVECVGSGACDDGSFCTATDTCNDGVCEGAGNPCSGDTPFCNETANRCDECRNAADCTDGLFCDGVETCSAGTCGNGTPPCTGTQICDEAHDQCDECNGPEDCDDGNVCTDDTCDVDGFCQHADNTAACDDGKFCTQTDTCSAGQCVGSGATCGAENCNEGTDTCGNCTGPSDCGDGNECTDDLCTDGVCTNPAVADGTSCTDDGAFCTGAESCQSGACTSAGNPCDTATQVCDEEGDRCVALCGNGRIDGEEACDDGNTDSLDGCSADCLEEPGWSCAEDPGPESVCTADCGDGVRAVGAEACDDGNSGAGDGCSEACAVETGWDCAPASPGGADVCTPLFGDGLVVGDEACDDGNAHAGDGCFEGAVEAGFTCDAAQPSHCTALTEDTAPGDGPAEDAGGDGAEAGPDATGDAVEPAPDGGGSSSASTGCCRTAVGSADPNGLGLLALAGALVVLRRRRRAG